MKILQKIKLLIVMMLILCPTSLLSETESKEQEPIAVIVSKEVQERLDEKNYTRIPNKDFDNLIENRITTILDDQTKSWLTFLGALLAVVGAVSLYAMKMFLKDAVTEQVKSELKESINDLDEKLQKNMEEDRTKISTELEAIKEYINSNKSILFEVQLNKYIEEGNRTNIPENLIPNMKKLLENVDAIGDSDLFSKAFDQLIRICYRQRKDAEIDRLLDQYSDKDAITYPTLFNAALPHYDAYFNTLADFERNKALEYLDKCLVKLANYGHAFALKLQLLMVDYNNAETGAEQQKRAENEAKRVLVAALKSFDSSIETAERLKTDEKIYGSSVRRLYDLFPEKMKELNAKASLYQEYKQALADKDYQTIDSIKRTFDELGTNGDAAHQANGASQNALI